MTSTGGRRWDTGQDEGLLDFLYQFPVAVLRIGGAGEIERINPRAAALLQALGLPVIGAQAGRLLLQALHPATAAQAFGHIDQVGTVVSRLPLVRDDAGGQQCHIDLTVQVVNAGSLMVTLEDVTELRSAVAAQQDSARRYRDLIEVIPAGVVIHAPTSEIRVANAEASRLLGLTQAQLLGRVAVDPRWRFIREDGSAMPLSEYPVSQVLATGQALENLVLGIVRPGQDDVVWVMVNAIPVHGAAGSLREVCVSFTDVSQMKRAEQALRQSEERYRLVLRGSNDAPWDWDLLKGSLYYSPRWWEMLGREPEPAVDDPALWESLLHPEDRDRVRARVGAALADGSASYEVECRLRGADGEYVDILSRGFILRNDRGRAVRVSGTNLDLRERKRAAAEIQRLAFTDPLTHLPNRRRLLEKAQDALTASARSRRHGALIFIDLDRFKELNDTRGHACGDLLLQQIAQRLLVCTRDTDTLARLGGDEFVLLLEHLDPDAAVAPLDAERAARKVLAAMARPFQLGQQSHTCTASVGVAMFGPGSASVEELLKQADLAMYRAKSMGNGRMQFFDRSMQAAVERRVSLEADLRAGIARDELLLHYQAQVNHHGQVTGAEVLVRWKHPVHGLMMPGDFVGLAEETGLILPLGRWVLRTACLQLARWRASPGFAGLSLSVNVSVHQLHDEHFVQDVLAVLTETGADADRLVLEVTESALAQDIEEIIAKLHALRAHGVTFALDDFGTGYSSLGYLKRLPMQALKIDRTFVRDVLTDPGDATLVRTIVSLGREFGVAVLAEGVETEAQRQFLEGVGCLTYQGYLFGRPQTIEGFERDARA
jgi:diguanylate cyclase (GGDEF)-like protein/PAS domain S-box-containing protein